MQEMNDKKALLDIDWFRKNLENPYNFASMLQMQIEALGLKTSEPITIDGVYIDVRPQYQNNKKHFNYKIQINNPNIIKADWKWEGLKSAMDCMIDSAKQRGSYLNWALTRYDKSKKYNPVLDSGRRLISILHMFGGNLWPNISTRENGHDRKEITIEFSSISYDCILFPRLVENEELYSEVQQRIYSVGKALDKASSEYKTDRIKALHLSSVEYQILASEKEELSQKLKSVSERLSEVHKELIKEDSKYISEVENKIVSQFAEDDHQRLKSLKDMGYPISFDASSQKLRVNYGF